MSFQKYSHNSQQYHIESSPNASHESIGTKVLTLQIYSHSLGILQKKLSNFKKL